MRHGKATADPAFVMVQVHPPALRKRKCTECTNVVGGMLNFILKVLGKTRIHIPATVGNISNRPSREKKSNP